MGLKDTVMEMLASGRERDLADLASTDPRALRPLLGRLWDPDPQIRERAARAIGRAGAQHPERGNEIARRLMWGLNDESATNGVYGVPALGELGRHAPDLLAPFLPGLVRFAEDDGLRPAILAALVRIAATRPDLVAPHLRALDELLDRERPEELRPRALLAEAVREWESDD